MISDVEKKAHEEAEARIQRAKVEPAARRLLRKLHSERGEVFTRAQEDALAKTLSTGKLAILKAITGEKEWQAVAQGVLDQAKGEADPEPIPEAQQPIEPPAE